MFRDLLDVGALHEDSRESLKRCGVAEVKYAHQLEEEAYRAVGLGLHSNY